MSPNGPPGPEQRIGEDEVTDISEETPDFNTIQEAQNTYESLLEELDHYRIVDLQGGKVDQELDLVKDDIRDTRAYLKVELEGLEAEDFMEDGADTEKYSEILENMYGPRVENIKQRFEMAEEYWEEIR